MQGFVNSWMLKARILMTQKTCFATRPYFLGHKCAPIKLQRSLPESGFFYSWQFQAPTIATPSHTHPHPTLTFTSHPLVSSQPADSPDLHRNTRWFTENMTSTLKLSTVKILDGYLADWQKHATSHNSNELGSRTSLSLWAIAVR